MKLNIINNCSKVYRINHEKIIRKILGKIPSKYLDGLSEIILNCEENKFVHRMRYSLEKTVNKSAIEINIAIEDYNKYPFFSEFSFNIDFISKVNEHVVKSVKPYSNDPDILMYHSGRLNPKWMYLGNWTPILYLFNIIIYPIRKIEYFRSIIFRYSKKIMGR